MASVWKQSGSRYFTACFRDANGRQRRISTKETGRKKAHIIAVAFETAARRKRTKFHTQFVIAQLHEELGGEPISTVPLSEVERQLPNHRDIGCTNCNFNIWPEILEFHHIDRNRKNNSLENLTILCPNCHRAHHRKLLKTEFKSLADLLNVYQETCHTQTPALNCSARLDG